MSGLEVVAAVSAVISAFHGGAELVKTIKKKHNRRRKSEQAYREKALQESLESGETQIGQRYAADYGELGQAFRIGDDIARDRLLHIAVVMQAEIIRSLQIAVQYENAILDLTLLQEASVTNRYDTINTLDGLRQRIVLGQPVERPIRIPSQLARRSSSSSVRTFLTANSVTSDFVPAAVTIADAKDSHGRIGSFLSIRKSTKSRDVGLVGESRISLIPNFDWLAPAIQHREDDFTTACLGQIGSDKESHGCFTQDKHNSTSTYSGHSEHVLSDSDVHESIGSVSPSEQPTSPLSPRLDFSIVPDGVDLQEHYARPIKQPSYRWSTISMPANPQSMLGRPSKDNNYWGFCKGAWSCREEVKKGLQIQTRPEGMYNTKFIWECRYCSFQGEIYGKKRYTVDPSVHNAAGGIRYRWIFLAKSHVKKKNIAQEKDQCNYGCMFCCIEGRGTGIFGNVETLMNHILVEHGKSMTPDLQERTRCVFGRLADSSEAFDINIPHVSQEHGYG